MSFTVKGFPGRTFKSMVEYQQALKELGGGVSSLPEPAEVLEEPGEITRVTATLLPAPRDLIEGKVAELESQMAQLMKIMQALLNNSGKANKEGLLPGTVLQGESKGNKYTLEALEEGYLCSDGEIYESLSGAALGVSGNRRSGWKFWKNVEGRPIGELTGRFNSHGNDRSRGT